MVQLLSELSVSFQRDKAQYFAISFIFYFAENTIKDVLTLISQKPKQLKEIVMNSALSPTGHFYPL